MYMQGFMDAISDACMRRSGYHLTIGGLIDVLSVVDGKAVVKFDYDHYGYPSNPHSYRGYYSDLSFGSSTKKASASSLLKTLKKSVGNKFTGYKGGDFEMDRSTPLWVSNCGFASGIAMVDAKVIDGDVVISTRIVG